ncbi:MAG: DNA alkylation repair protein [Paludibacteraceae bacterium]|nr:DNA alkylation repair protein [Paludibacteraceae bacterium]
MLHFFRFDKEVDEQMRSIRKYLVASMNGVVSSGLKHLGYKMSYGVSLMRIKELSARFTGSSKLARCLWHSGCREMMIMATYLQPVDEFTEREALSWLKECKNMELAEQLSRNLCSRLSFADSLLIKLKDENSSEYMKAFAYILASLQVKKEGTQASFLSAYEEKARVDVYSQSSAVYSGVSRFLKELCILDADRMRKFANELDMDKGPGAAWVREEMLTVLDFG